MKVEKNKVDAIKVINIQVSIIKIYKNKYDIIKVNNTKVSIRKVNIPFHESSRMTLITLAFTSTFYTLLWY